MLLPVSLVKRNIRFWRDKTILLFSYLPFLWFSTRIKWTPYPRQKRFCGSRRLTNSPGDFFHFYWNCSSDFEFPRKLSFDNLQGLSNFLEAVVKFNFEIQRAVSLFLWQLSRVSQTSEKRWIIKSSFRTSRWARLKLFPLACECLPVKAEFWGSIKEIFYVIWFNGMFCLFFSWFDIPSECL